MDFPFTIGADGVKVLKINNREAYSKYIFYYLQTLKLPEAGYSRHFKFLKEVKIPIPESKTYQIRIATVLSRAEALIAQRKESIKLLDDLLRAKFLEMFGDPVTNIKNWEKVFLDKISKSRLGKMLDASKQKGIHKRKYLANFNVQWFKINFEPISEMNFLDKELIDLELKFGDLLICEGGEVGRTAIWKNEKSDIYFQKAIHRLRPDYSEVTSDYLAYFFWFTATRTKFKKIVGNSTISHLTGEKLDKILIPKPPLPLQKQFVQFVEKVEKIKLQYTQSLNELEQLYGSLSQRAFKGELNLDFEVEEKRWVEEDKNLCLSEAH